MYKPVVYCNSYLELIIYLPCSVGRGLKAGRGRKRRSTTVGDSSNSDNKKLRLLQESPLPSASRYVCVTKFSVAVIYS